MDRQSLRAPNTAPVKDAWHKFTIGFTRRNEIFIETGGQSVQFIRYLLQFFGNAVDRHDLYLFARFFRQPDNARQVAAHLRPVGSHTFF